MKEFWSEFYDAVKEILFTEKSYVFNEIVNQPKTMREISEATGIPYVTVRKYVRWAKDKNLVFRADVVKVGSVLAEKWLLTFVPEVLDVEKSLVLRVMLRIKMRREFCESFCPLKDKCPAYKRFVEKGEVPYREVLVEKRFVKSDDWGFCRIVSKKEEKGY